MPATSVPMKLPSTTLPVAPAPAIPMPKTALPEMIFRAAGSVPPIVLFAEPSMKMPSPALPIPASLSQVGAEETTRDQVAPRARQVDPRAGEQRDDQPLDRGVAGGDRQPVHRGSGARTRRSRRSPMPGWLVPSMVTGLVISGRADVGRMIGTAVPGMSKSIVFAAARSPDTCACS